jgi:endoglucanase
MPVASLAAVVLAVSAARATPAGERAPAPPDAAPRPAALVRVWKGYVDAFVTADGRVMDPKRDGLTTSEGQTYCLVQAVWADDPETFDRVHAWTRTHLQGGDPSALPAWAWGRRPDGSLGPIDPQPASDADQLLAWALLLAARRWGRPALVDEARGVLGRIWAEEVRTLGPHLVLLPGPWAGTADPVLLNPSYFLPFALRDFAAADPSHDWDRLRRDGYTLLEGWMAGGALPPDWVSVDATTGARVDDPPSRPGDRAHGYEAIRLPWALAADAAWNAEPRADALLAPWAVLAARWTETGFLPARMAADGTGLEDYEEPAMMGALLPAWERVAPAAAAALYRTELRPRRQRPGWAGPDDYYAQNWIWFGLALWSGLARPLPQVG